MPSGLQSAGIQSKRQFLFGSTEMLIKLVPRDSAGTVTAYYLSTPGEARFEVDFEFLGNLSGQPYTIQTNIYLLGLGNREQQFKPWFDPTADFHNYTIHWNPSQIVWFVDGHPIRVFRNLESRGIAYPNNRGMNVYASLWNADDWATEGGRIKTDWNSQPFIARLRRLRLRACKWHGPNSIQQCASAAPGNWWSSPVYSQLTYAQEGQLKWVRDNFMIYDYCKDPNRYNGKLPPECYVQTFP
ncbi:putative xyloglucan endotransglucosylase/hydrolase protein 26 [Asimina triloba]